MKKILFSAVLIAVAFTFFGCVSNTGTKVNRLEADKVTDLSGYWNDTDVRIVSDDLIAQCLDAPWYNEFAAANGGKKPIIIVGTFRNQSDEHIDTTIISSKIERSLVNSRKVTSVANATTRSEVRAERDDQQVNSSVETAKILMNETAADYILQGAVKTIVDSAGNVMTRTYYVSAELVNIETNEKVWLGDNSSIKKQIKTANVRK